MKAADRAAGSRSATDWRARLAWLEQQPWHRFLGILYVLRWLVLAVVLLPAWLLAPHWLKLTSAEDFAPTGVNLAITLLVIAPVVETLGECTAVWWLLRTLMRRPPPRGLFMLLSAAVMVAVHPPFGFHWVPTFITGLFLAFIYSHFVAWSHRAAFAATCGFHAAINLVGVAFLLPQLMGK